MAIKAVVFDLYGVLGLNGWQDFKMKHFAGRWDEWEPIRRLGQRLDAGEASEDEFVLAIAKATGETEEIVKHQFAHTEPNTKLLEFIRDDLKPKYKIAMLSNASRDVLPGIFTPSERTLFDTVVLSMHLGLTKPDLAMFRHVCTKLGVLPEETIFIDDQERHLAPAREVGMRPILYKSVSQVEQDIQTVIGEDIL